mmetsp:Transcript_58149/g.137241  ORF Transcript_58149/g.137241 Transcript_58149/m.137241 type:complete len:246 (+) Transcript_58149:61-798(+)
MTHTISGPPAPELAGPRRFSTVIGRRPFSPGRPIKSGETAICSTPPLFGGPVKAVEKASWTRAEAEAEAEEEEVGRSAPPDCTGRSWRAPGLESSVFNVLTRERMFRRSLLRWLGPYPCAASTSHTLPRLTSCHQFSMRATATGIKSASACRSLSPDAPSSAPRDGNLRFSASFSLIGRSEPDGRTRTESRSSVSPSNMRRNAAIISKSTRSSGELYSAPPPGRSLPLRSVPSRRARVVQGRVCE